MRMSFPREVLVIHPQISRAGEYLCRTPKVATLPQVLLPSWGEDSVIAWRIWGDRSAPLLKQKLFK